MMRRFFLITVAVLALSGCGDVEDTEEYQQGYDDGHAEGYDEGKRIGHEEGKEEGIEEGKDDVCRDIEYRLNRAAREEVC